MPYVIQIFEVSFGFYTILVSIIYFRCIIYDGMKYMEATFHDLNLFNSVIHKATKWIRHYIMIIGLN